MGFARPVWKKFGRIELEPKLLRSHHINSVYTSTMLIDDLRACLKIQHIHEQMLENGQGKPRPVAFFFARVHIHDRAKRSTINGG